MEHLDPGVCLLVGELCARPERNTGCAPNLELVLHVALAAEPNKKNKNNEIQVDWMF